MWSHPYGELDGHIWHPKHDLILSLSIPVTKTSQLQCPTPSLPLSTYPAQVKEAGIRALSQTREGHMVEALGTAKNGMDE